MNNWIKVISFTLPHEANMAKAFLEASDIEVIIVDELTVQVNNFYSNAIGGVKLFVEEGKLEEALMLLESGGYIVKSGAVEKVIVETFSDEYQGKCPYCERENVTKKNMAGYVFIISIMLLGFPFPFLRKRYYCYDCSREWKIKR